MAIGDTWEIIIKGACVGQAIYNVLHFQDGEGSGDLEDLRAHLEDDVAPDLSWIENLMNVVCADYTISSFLATKIFPLPKGPQLEKALLATHTGDLETAEALPTSAVVKWVTLMGGRSGRGRSYFGPLGAGSVTDGSLHVTRLTELANLVIATKSLFTTGGAAFDGHWTFGVWSRLNSEFHEMTDGIVRTAAKTQRRRQLGVGI